MPIKLKTGPMFSKKTTEAILELAAFETLKTYRASKENRSLVSVAFKPVADDRDTKRPNALVTHDDLFWPAIPIHTPEEVWPHIANLERYGARVALYVFDEAELYMSNDSLIRVATQLDKPDVDVVISGLDYFATLDAWEPIPSVRKIAHSYTQSFATCDFCGSRYADRTYKKSGNYELKVEIAAEKVYGACCLKCHPLYTG